MDGAVSIYVVDNGSGDGSPDIVIRWLDERFRRSPPRDSPSLLRWTAPDTRIALISLDSNLGYAGGNNAGIRRAITDGAAAIWVLNNDTVVAEDALMQIVGTADDHPDAGVVGACLLEWDSSRIQTFGGARYIWPLTRHRPIGKGLPVSSVGRLSGSRLDYVAGASMFLPTSVLNEIGLLNEDYFLYGEELDYAERCRSSGKSLVVAASARVWHLQGASLGSGTNLASRSTTSAFYASRSAIILVRRFRPNLLPIVLPVRVLLSLLFLARGRPGLAAATLRGIASGLAAPLRDAPRISGSPIA
jgi:GT2 family glycosyltransferase